MALTCQFPSWMDTVMINQAMVTVADLVAGNGVVHVIDAVLLH